ncbi:Trace amine-associated receptor 4 [Oryzias melastigma]|uniref:Trace amine-associated receptor 4 n=1 Tax=Oryzias melastigma TaxID=30732 RepID=A0A834FA25_ORYME|nr:Trace amine-associated receptor 4 [Oryzias melastigma]
MQTQEKEAGLCFPHLQNSSCRRSRRPPAESMLMYITLSSMSVLTVALNLLVIISISHFKRLQTPTNLLLLSLAVSDFFVGLLVVFQILLIDGCWFLGDVMCVGYYIVDYVITSASVETVVLISVDCYVAICEPLQYFMKVTKRRVCISVSGCWIFSFLCVFIVMKDNLRQPGRHNSCYGECVVVFDQFSGLVDILFFFIGPVSVVVVLYVRVFVVAVSQARAMRSHPLSVHGSARVTLKKSDLKSARTLGLVGLAFLICLCPYFSLTLTGSEVEFQASSFAFVLFYFNSLLNPLIYALFYPWFRKSAKLIVTLQVLRPGSSQINVE